VDSITHALIAAIVFSSLGLPKLLPFGVLGVVIIDADIIFSLFSHNHPALYLFVHGGIAHSLSGAVAMAFLAYAGCLTAAFFGLVNPLFITSAGFAGFGAVCAGIVLHFALDIPAAPGIPLFAPFSDQKFSLFILPGPSSILLAASLFFIVWMALGVVSFLQGMAVYAAIFVVFILCRCAAFLASRPGLHGTTCALPQINPFRWLAISETPEGWDVWEHTIGSGPGDVTVYPKFRNTSSEEIAPYRSNPEVRRLYYHSYIVTAEREGNTLIFTDPLRVSARIFYPPHFKEVRIEADGRRG